MKKKGMMIGLVLALLLVGCQSTPQGKFSPEQISAMRA